MGKYGAGGTAENVVEVLGAEEVVGDDFGEVGGGGGPPRLGCHCGEVVNFLDFPASVERVVIKNVALLLSLSRIS